MSKQGNANTLKGCTANLSVEVEKFMVGGSFCVADTGTRSFQSGPQSSWSARMKQVPDESDVRRRMRSAGTRWFFSSRARSPTRMEEGGTERVGGKSPSSKERDSSSSSG